MKKTCFVAMGFGKKMDYQNSFEVDLDKIYKEVIKPLFEKEFTDYKLVRADEIAGSALIDVSMYALLINADLVIADITTLNPNAIYELGVRHAVRPYSTIIMAQKSCKIPFDLNHSRFLTYDDIGEHLDELEAKVIQDELKKFVVESKNNTTDSPLYTFLPKVQPPTISDEEYSMLIVEAESKTDTISKIMENAEINMRSGNFVEAIKNWKQLKLLLPNNEYIVQQLALATYKSESPNKSKSLENALLIIKELKPEMSLDLETLGITGGIYKRLFRLNRNFDYLDEAISFYQKGFIIKNDYYNGENYANCMLLKTQQSSLALDEKINLEYNSKKVYERVIGIINISLADNEENIWMYATLAICYLGMGDRENYLKHQNLFYDKCTVEWEKASYKETLDELYPSISATEGGR